MNYILKGHDYINEIQTISQAFFQNEKFTAVDRVVSEGVTIISQLYKPMALTPDTEELNCGIECRSIIYENGEKECEDITDADAVSLTDTAEIKRLLKLSMFNALVKKTGFDMPWGILTGIRPAKIVSDLLDKGYADEEIEEHIIRKFLVSPEKVHLMTSIAKKERLITSRNTGDDYSLYLGIPFCPSRCLYCSFTSYPTDKYENKLEQYVSAVLRELELTMSFFSNKRLENIYIGGGTPASLPAPLLEKLLKSAAHYARAASSLEFTLEAGRPDVITAEKLDIMKKYNVTRLSINPQTMNNKTLARVGRAHTAEEFTEKFKLARRMGFKNINTDIILGLPGEDLKDVQSTLRQITCLQPENITIHTLAVKRSSALKEELLNNRVNGPGGWELSGVSQLIKEMLELSSEYMYSANMEPYYMYRQKNMAGNFENVGYCKPGYECLYNVQIMEEKQTVIALGAGGISKIVDLPHSKLERIFNVKNVDEYLLRIDEMLDRKKAFLE